MIQTSVTVEGYTSGRQATNTGDSHFEVARQIADVVESLDVQMKRTDQNNFADALFDELMTRRLQKGKNVTLSPKLTQVSTQDERG